MVRSAPVRLAALLGLLVIGAGLGCSTILGLGDLSDRATDAGAASDGASGPLPPAKVDVLLVVDDSASMADKSSVLASGIGSLLRRLAPAGDLHVGVITTSLGAMGGDLCADVEPKNRLAHLRTTDLGGAPVAGASNGFLSYGGGGSMDLDALVADTERLVRGVGENGCGVEAQLESAYRFLNQPDPWSRVTVTVGTGRAVLEGVDEVLLAQRKAFLRPDSFVAVLMLTDEDDSSADPRSVGGQGYAFMSSQFPGSTTFRADGRTTTAPRASSTCATNPVSPDCQSCLFAATCNTADASCQKLKNDAECVKNNGFFGPNEDQLNVRFHRMKQRFGIDPQFPLKRYVAGLSLPNVPNRDGEHEVRGTAIGDYLGTTNCTNPLFAAALPGTASEELCKLPLGSRGPERVFFAVIGGVPTELVAGAPDPKKLFGVNPDGYDQSGEDPHMIPSVAPRDGLPRPSAVRGDNGTDPVHGREWDTGGNDLQYACTFDLVPPRTCTAANVSCDCAGPTNPPVCGASEGSQVKAKAFPTLRELRVAQALGDRGVIGSICSSSATGYEATMSRLAERLEAQIRK